MPGYIPLTFRAEDGLQPPRGWRALCDTVLLRSVCSCTLLNPATNKSDRPRPDGEWKELRDP